MKILFLAKYLPQKGSTTHMYALAKELIARGHDVHLISSGPVTSNTASMTIYRDSVQLGLKHHIVPLPNTADIRESERVKLAFKYIAATPQILAEMFKIKPDVVHVHYPVTSYIAKIYKLLTGKKFVMTYHTSGISKHFLHKKADYVIAISQELKKELLETFDYSEDQIKLIYNGAEKKFERNVSHEENETIRIDLSLPLHKPIIGFVGMLDEGKGIDILLKACAQINQDFHVVLVGDGDKDWVKRLIKENNMSGKVAVFPFQDPYRFYSIFDIFVLPSRKEGFGLVSVEAMMMGVPIIRSNVGGSADQIIGGYNGFIFENEDSKELADDIAALIDDRILRNQMKEHAKDFALNHFTEDMMVTKILELYEETMGHM